MPRFPIRLLAVPLVAAYGFRRLSSPEYWDVLDDLNLAVHEAGHLVLLPFGEQGMTLGGSLFQVLVPLSFMSYFLHRRQRFAAGVVLAWVAASLGNVARYIGDARAQLLPLLGGDDAVHDWWFLLTEWDLLPHDTAIASGVKLCGVLAWILSVATALAFSGEPSARLQEVDSSRLREE